MLASNLYRMAPDLEHGSDDSLMAGVRSGRSDAFTLLFRRRRGDVYRFALHMSGSPAVADDVTQDVFLIVIGEAGRYEPGRSTVAAWLCGIARNCVRQRLARERDRRLQDLGSGIEEPAVHPDPVEDLSRAEEAADVRRAVLALPVKYREAVVMCDLQELSYAEAADALGCAIGTVRSRLHRARSLLAGRMMRLADERRAGIGRERRVSAPASEPGRGAATADVITRRCLA
jgi:RNA polymerase sigma-70 factor (ECF subfamily)